MLNIQGLMKQAQVMQKKMQEAQAKLAETEVEGVSANGAVKVVLNGKSEMKKISLDKSVVSEDDIEMLEDLIMAATNEALRAQEADANEQMSRITGGLGGFGGGFPF